MSAAGDNELRALIQQAERASAGGRRDEALRILARAHEAAPGHPLVLNAQAIQLLGSGDAASARAALERAVAVDPGSVTLWMNLATALRALGAREAEAKALESVLRLEPRHLVALLQKGQLQEDQGQHKAAARTFQNALQTLTPQTQLPNVLRDPIQRAIEAVRRNDVAMTAHIEQALARVRSEHTAAQLERADHGVSAFLGNRRIFQPQPTFLQVPKLPAYEFHDRAQFDWLGEFEAATAGIRAECERVMQEDRDVVPYIAHPDGQPLDQWTELNRSRKWSAFFLWRDGQRIDANADRCPVTAGLLSRAPLAEVAGYAPTAFFSILDKKTHIPPHTGVTNSRLIVHLPLVVPRGCRFRVGSETREWQEGSAWVFDDSIEHEAWNDSDVPRAILIFDTWNPWLNAAERALIQAAVPAIKDYYRGEVAITGSE